MPNGGGIQYTLKLDRGQIEKLAGGKDIRKGLEIVGQVGEDAAKRYVAVDTGNLRRSITHELGGRGFNQYVRIGTNVLYGLFQEIGTRNMPAHPFLRPAMSDIKSFVGG